MCRVAVFLDYENVRKTAYRAFPPSKSAGTLDLVAIAKRLAYSNQRDKHRKTQLVAIEAHRGLPDRRLDKERHAHARALEKTWAAASPILTTHLRPLRYRKDRGGLPRGEEKGVDVQLAVSVIRWILKNECDTAILFSHDSDFSPVIEMLAETEGPHRIETASWYSKTHRQRIPNHTGVYNHYLNHTDYLTLTGN